MEDEEKKALKENIKKFLSSARLVYDNNYYTSAAILYFKSFFSVFDLLILNKTGKVPKDHSERFRILEINYPIFYRLLDKLYPTYRNTYTTIISKSNCNEVKENVERIIKEQRIFENY